MTNQDPEPMEAPKTITHEIHAVVSPSGKISAGLWTDDDGEDTTDVGVLYDHFWNEDSVPLQIIKITATIDLEELFKAHFVEGEVSKSSQEGS